MRNENEFNRPKYDAKTGELIQYDDVDTTEDTETVISDSSEEQAEVFSAETSNHIQHSEDSAQQESSASIEEENGSTEYRYSRNEIPFNNQNTEAYGQTFMNESQMNQTFGSTGNMYGNNAGTQYGGPQYGNGPYSGPSYGNPSYGQAPYQSNVNAAKAKKAKKEKTKKEKGKSSLGRKIMVLLASAAVFGMVAGGVMYGVYYAGSQLFPASRQNDYNISSVTSNIPTTAFGSGTEEGSTDGIQSSMNVSAVARAALPAMVALEGTTTVSSSNYYGGFGGQNYEASTSGTGIIVGKNDTELLILTNAHVIENVNGLKCVFVDGEAVNATVKGSKSEKDIAVVAVSLADIKSDTISKIAIAELGDSDNVEVGEQVVAIGNALGEGQSVTNGIVSALNRSITVNNVTFDGLFMTNAAINSGNSGGALLNAEGRVIGINFAKTSENGVEGMAYSIPVSNVRELIDSLMNRETRTKVNEDQASYLGISGVDITSAMANSYGYPQGVYIRAVNAGSAAEKAGLGAYDIIVSFDDQTVSSMTGLQTLLQYYEAGETVSIEYYHIEGSEYVRKTVEVTLDKKPN